MLDYTMKQTTKQTAKGRVDKSTLVLYSGLLTTTIESKVTRLLYSARTLQERIQEVIKTDDDRIKILDYVQTTTLDPVTGDELRVVYDPPFYPVWTRPLDSVLNRAKLKRDREYGRVAWGSWRQFYGVVCATHAPLSSNHIGTDDGWRAGHVDPINAVDPYSTVRMELWRNLLILARFSILARPTVSGI
jgi:hypothetical protein